MIELLLIILLIMYMAGIITGITAGGWIHLLGAIVLIVLILRLASVHFPPKA